MVIITPVVVLLFYSSSIVTAQLLGTYDVGGGNNHYSNPVEAANALQTWGMSGPVTFNVYSGTYDGQVDIPWTISGLSAANHLVFRAALGESPVITNTIGVWDTTGNGFYLSGADYVTIQGFEITNYRYNGIYSRNSGSDSSTDNQFIGNYIQDTSPYGSRKGIKLYTAADCIVIRNEIDGNRNGISIVHSDRNLIANNMVYGAYYTGIYTSSGNNNRHYYNSVYLDGEHAGFRNNNSPGSIFINNISYQVGIWGWAFYCSSSSQLVSDYNDWYAPNGDVVRCGYHEMETLAEWQTWYGFDLNSISADPQFISLTGRANLHLDTTNASPVHSAGSPVFNISGDFDGDRRNSIRPDIGADEIEDSQYCMHLSPENQQTINPPNTTIDHMFYLDNCGKQDYVYNLTVIVTGQPFPHTIMDHFGIDQIDSISMTSFTLDSFLVRVEIPGGANPVTASNGTIVVQSRYGMGYLTSDTSNIITYTTFSGGFDIGGGNNDFPNPVSAANALQAQGMTGPVTFNLYSGTYYGQITIRGTISGLGVENPLTIKNAPGESPVIANPDSTYYTNNNCFYILGADYVTIKGLEITDCYYAGILSTYDSVYSDSSHHIKIIGNYFPIGGSAEMRDAIHLSYVSDCKVIINESWYEIYIGGGQRNLIANNMVYDDWYGIWITSGNDNRVIYNSVVNNNSNGVCCRIMSARNLVIMNNIFYHTAAGNYGGCFMLQGSPSYYNITSDYNDLYSPYGNIGYYSGIYFTLQSWQSATGLDAHSISADPHFINLSNDLHIDASHQPSPVDSAGTPITEITTDFDGDPRDPVTPDIGADEFSILFPVDDLYISLTDGGTNITLIWSPTQNTQQYHIYKSTTNPQSGFVLLGSTTNSSFTDSTAMMTNNTSFYYVTSDNQLLDTSATQRVPRFHMHNSQVNSE